MSEKAVISFGSLNTRHKRSSIVNKKFIIKA